ncbi:hypothetical protein EDD21DRAFT_378991 [Dissophora ornata]|nr:hypothetical protein EDD21DRAFT_378991 [Dissophora ornata]
MLHDAFSAFGTIRTLNVVHPKACAFVEFASPEAHQNALAATSVPVGDGHENVLTEKRVRKQQQPLSFTRRLSANNLKSMAFSNNTQAAYTPHAVSITAATTSASKETTIGNGHDANSTRRT